MIKSRRQFLALGGAATASALIAACSSGSSPSTAGKSTTGTTTLSVAPAIMPFYVAQTQGYLKEYDIALNITNTFLPASTVLPSLGHQYDFGLVTIPDTLSAYAAGVKTKIVFADTTESAQYPQSYLIAEKSVTSLADLAGKTIAVIAESGSLYLGLLYELKKAGLTSSDLRFVAMQENDMPPELEAGRVQAALLVAPLQAPLTAETSKYTVLDLPVVDAGGGSAVDSVIVASASWAAANVTLVNNFRSAMVAAQQWINTHVTETAKLYETLSYFGDTPTEIADSTAWDIVNSPLGLQTSTAQVQTWITVMEDLGQLSAGAVTPSDVLLPWPSGLSSAVPASSELTGKG